MKTPIFDFVKGYAESGISRFHMPGHKGKTFLGCEPLDITEIDGADVLYSADGIIAESEEYAKELFGSRRTYYSTEGSSLAIKAMLSIATSGIKNPTVLAARNAHKSFVHACALLGIDVRWIYPDSKDNICRLSLTPSSIEGNISGVDAVYITSPDYLGNIQDIANISKVCHKHGVPLLVDNAHGAYLRFLEKSLHPINLGADMCCDSAHKTLPVLTGGAYLHIANEEYIELAEASLSVFASTSPSYLILQSLDICNKYLADGYRERLSACLERTKAIKDKIRSLGFTVEDTEPLKLTVNATSVGYTGRELAVILKDKCIEVEFSDAEYVVLMATPENSDEDFERLVRAFSEIEKKTAIEIKKVGIFATPVRKMSIREAMFKPRRLIPLKNAVGRICATPIVSCPPAIPVVVSGEVIGEEHTDVLASYGIQHIEVVSED